MSIERIKELWAEDEYWSIEEYVIEEGEWVSEGKYEYNSSILKFEDKYYQINRSRSGSYYSDYYYNDADIFEVTPEKKIVETTVWNPVNEDPKTWATLPES